jgi:hypothetical protein
MKIVRSGPNLTHNPWLLAIVTRLYFYYCILTYGVQVGRLAQCDKENVDPGHHKCGE